MNQSRSEILKSKSNEMMPLTAEGSLGLLALGDIGLELWRKAKEAEKKSADNSSFHNVKVKAI